MLSQTLKIFVKHAAHFIGSDLSRTEFFAEASKKFELDGAKRKQLKIESGENGITKVYSEFLVEYNKGESGDDVKHCVRNDIIQMFSIDGYQKTNETIEMRRKPERIIRKKRKKKST